VQCDNVDRALEVVLVALCDAHCRHERGFARLVRVRVERVLKRFLCVSSCRG
jgi:hypothetical protein